MSEASSKNNDKDDDKKKSGGKKTLSLGGTLSLKGPAPGASKSASPGTVAVEVRRKRAPSCGGAFLYRHGTHA